MEDIAFLDGIGNNLAGAFVASFALQRCSSRRSGVPPNAHTRQEARDFMKACAISTNVRQHCAHSLCTITADLHTSKQICATLLI